jgi:hypothetical protein
MKMKYLLFAMISIAVSSCGGLESKVKKLAEKECECEKLKGKEENDCEDEGEDMSKDLRKEIEDAKLKSDEKTKLDELYANTYKNCKGK